MSFIAILIGVAISGAPIVATELTEEKTIRIFDTVEQCTSQVQRRVQSAEGQVQEAYGFCMPLRKNAKQNWKKGSTLKYDEIKSEGI